MCKNRLKSEYTHQSESQISGDGIFKITGRGAECCTPTTLKIKYEHVDKRGPRPSDPWEGQNICRKTNKKGNFCAYPSGTLNQKADLFFHKRHPNSTLYVELHPMPRTLGDNSERSWRYRLRSNKTQSITIRWLYVDTLMPPGIQSSMIDYAQSIKTNSPVVYDHTAHPSRWVSYMYSTVSIC